MPTKIYNHDVLLEVRVLYMSVRDSHKRSPDRFKIRFHSV